MEDSEAKMKAREDEVSRFNNYIDAIYRRMNAALRAKMMDPMTLNLDDRQKKKQSPRRSLNKREADGEDDYDDSEAVLAEDELQSRAGKPERANKNKSRNGAAARRSKKNKKSKKGEKEQKRTKKAEREAAKKEKQEKKMKKQELREKKREEKK